MKKLISVYITILLVSVVLLSCKKSTPKITQPAYTRLDTVTITIGDTGIVSKNNNGQWIVTLSTTMNPYCDSLSVLGVLTYNVYDGNTFKYTQTDQNAQLATTMIDILNGTFSSPNVQLVQYEDQSWHSFGTIDYIPTFNGE